MKPAHSVLTHVSYLYGAQLGWIGQTTVSTKSIICDLTEQKRSDGRVLTTQQTTRPLRSGWVILRGETWEYEKWKRPMQWTNEKDLIPNIKAPPVCTRLLVSKTYTRHHRRLSMTLKAGAVQVCIVLLRWKSPLPSNPGFISLLPYPLCTHCIKDLSAVFKT